MRRLSLFVAASVVVFIAGTTGVVRSATPAPSLTAHLNAERTRLRAHFDSVLAELESVDVSALTVGQRESRATLIAWLNDYRDAGMFPLNDLGTRARTPIFRDSRGVLCAMAYLIDRSGRGDLVDDVARSRNTAYIAELADDARLVAWLDSAGLTEGEAARIQPTYSPHERLIERNYTTEVTVLVGLSAASATVNFLRPSPVRGWLGLVIGGATIARGAPRTYESLWERIPFGGTSPQLIRKKDEAAKRLVIGAGSLAVIGGFLALRQTSEPSSDASTSMVQSALDHLILGIGGSPSRRGSALIVGFREVF